jgi:hypothetical protein
LDAAGCGVALPLLDAGLLCDEMFEEEMVTKANRTAATLRHRPVRMNVPRRRTMEIAIAYHHPPAGTKDQSHRLIDAYDPIPSLRECLYALTA